MPKDQNTLIECRVERGSKAAIVFIHGGGGDPQDTWGKFPEFIAGDSRAGGWDIYSYGYTSTGINRVIGMGGLKWLKRALGIDIDPTVSMLANGFSMQLATGQFRNYAALAIVSHSLGGIVAQKLLVDYPDMRARVRYLFLMGVSSDGFADKLLLTRNMAQINEIRPGTPLIVDLRKSWKELFIDKPAPFEYWAIAGDQDGFVPPDSSLGPFPPDRRRVVPGDHESMKEPKTAASLAVQFVLEQLAGQLSADRWGSARVAVELGQYQHAITQLEPHLDDLDESGLVTLALAYESVGRQSDAQNVLSRTDRYADAMDALGVLAGRLKRRWWLNRTASDAQRALDLYSEAYRRAVAKGRSDQAFYHGINVAFMQLAYQRQAATAAEMAREVLKHCENSRLDYWRLATQGEANLYLENIDAAADNYRDALNCDPAPTVRERQSMYEQAMRVISCLPGLVKLSKRLDETFR